MEIILYLVEEVSNEGFFISHITEITSVVNLLIVILFFVLTWNSNKKQQKVSIKTHWFREIYLPRYIDALREYESEVILLMERNISEEDSDEFEEGFNKILGVFYSKAEIFNSVEETLASKVFDFIQDSEDFIKNCFYNREEVDFKKDENINKVFSLLYSYDLDKHTI